MVCVNVSVNKSLVHEYNSNSIYKYLFLKISVKDAGVILTISSLLSIILVTCTIGVSGILERLHQNDLTELILASVFFVCLFALLSYLLVKMAAHYIVYLAIATFCGIIFPVSRRKQRSTVNEIYDRANK